MNSCLRESIRLGGAALLLGSFAGGAAAQSPIQLSHTPVTVSVEAQPIIAEIRVVNNRLDPDVRQVPPPEGQQYWLFAVELLNTGEALLDEAKMVSRTVEGDDVILLTPMAIGGYMRTGAAQLRLGPGARGSMSFLAIVPAGAQQIEVTCVTCGDGAVLRVALP